jgi:hypothetical protein
MRVAVAALAWFSLLAVSACGDDDPRSGPADAGQGAAVSGGAGGDLPSTGGLATNTGGVRTSSGGTATAATGGASASGGAGGAGGDRGSGGSSTGGSGGTGGKGESSDSGAPPHDDGVHPWPGPDHVVTVDPESAFDTNMSDLAYQPARGLEPAVLWAIQNGPSKLYRLVDDAGGWKSSTASSWGSGKTLYWPGAEKGSPDTEGVTQPDPTSPIVYASTERDNTVNQNRFSVLRFDTSQAGSSLTATHEWNLTADIPKVSTTNLGLESVAFIPDAYLVERGFYDETKQKKYTPADYPAHAGGIFLVGVEATGIVYGYVLDEAGTTFHRVTAFASDFVSKLGGSTVVGLVFDRDLSLLWASCDDNCDNELHLFEVDTAGRFSIVRRYARPGTLAANMNNEGFAFVPVSECAAGLRAFFWINDGPTANHVLRRDGIPCGGVP